MSDSEDLIVWCAPPPERLIGTGNLFLWYSIHLLSPDFAAMYEYIIAQGASINLYMFIGGTNFGFMNGANLWGEWPVYWPLVTSYGELTHGRVAGPRTIIEREYFISLMRS